MRSVVLVFLFSAGLVCSTPVDRERDRDVEYVDADDSRRVPEVRDYGVDPSLFRPIEDDGFDSDEDDFYGFPQRPSFPGNDDYFRRLQHQLTMMRRILRNWFNYRPIAPPRFPPGFFGPSDFGNFSDLPPNYDNSTYTTKNINGTIVYVNETIKKVDNNDSSFVFHVKTIQLRPENETAGSDDGLTVIEGEQVDLAGEGGQSSDANTTEAPAITSSESSSDASPSDSESPIVTTESAATVSPSPSSTSEDPTANDVNLARRFRRSFAQ